MPLILTILEPWKIAFGSFHITAFDQIHGDVVEIKLSLTPSPMVPLPLLREAMDLLHLAVVLDGSVVHELVQREWIDVELHPQYTNTDDFIQRLQTKIRAVVFTVAHSGLLIHLFSTALMAIVSPTTIPAQSKSGYSAAHAALRRHATAAATAAPLSVQQRLDEPVRILCSIATRDESTFRMLQGDAFFDRQVMLSTPLVVYDFFHQLTSLVKHARKSRRSRYNPRFDLHCITLKLETCLPLTPCIVQAAETLMLADHIGRVVCTEIKLDPRLISCPQDDLVTFMRAISRGSPGLSVATGFTPFGTRMKRIDSHGEDRSELIRGVMHAIAVCECLVSVDLGPLLVLLTQPRNRKWVWRGLFEILLASPDSSPIGELVIDSDTTISDQDAHAIRSLRHLHHRPRRTVNCLRLSAHHASTTAVVAVLALVRDMTKMDLALDRANVTTRIVSTILQQCQLLRSLRLCNATIASMAVFSDPKIRSPTTECLEELELFVPVIQDRSSMQTFLRELMDPTTAIAHSLHTLAFECPYGSNDGVFDVATATLFKQVLESNRTLRQIEVVVTSEVPRELRAALRSHTGDIIVREGLIPEQEARKAAFLSVVRAKECESAKAAGSACSRLDAMMVRQIMAFTAPFDLRSVTVSLMDEDENEDEGEDDSDSD